jgi:peptidoglycan/LPS O-acetylase OafA/YrhL
MKEKPNQFVHLDFLRGMAALAVLANHLRAFLIYPLTNSTNVTSVGKTFYFFTGFGHLAVIIFFVLSGFLICRGIAIAHSKDRWSWKIYLTNRMTRLWLVLFPALIFTLLWDKIGILLTDSNFYKGVLFDHYNSGPMAKDANDSLLTFIGNLLFLQTIYVSTYGSNGPLWSLAYEFWYYIIFPLTYTTLLEIVNRNKIYINIFKVYLIAMLIVILPFSIISFGLVWLLGYLVYLANENIKIKRIFSNLFIFIIVLLMFLTYLSLIRIGIIKGFWLVDFGLGCSVALLILTLVNMPVKFNVYAKIARRISSVSYSLYLGHFPFLAFIVCVFLNNRQYKEGMNSYLLYSLLFITSVLFSWLMWWLFERRTEEVKNIIIRRMHWIR